MKKAIERTALVRAEKNVHKVIHADDYTSQKDFAEDLRGNGYRVLKIWNGYISEEQAADWQFLNRNPREEKIINNAVEITEADPEDYAISQEAFDIAVGAEIVAASEPAPEFKYYIQSRRPIAGAVPAGYISATAGEMKVHSLRTDGSISIAPRKVVFGVATYDHPLSDEQIINYDLYVDPRNPKVEVDASEYAITDEALQVAVNAEIELATAEESTEASEINTDDLEIFSAKVRGLSFEEFIAEKSGLTIEEYRTNEIAKTRKQEKEKAQASLQSKINNLKSDIRYYEFDANRTARTLYGVIIDNLFDTDDSLKTYAAELEEDFNATLAKLTDAKAQLAELEPANVEELTNEEVAEIKRNNIINELKSRIATLERAISRTHADDVDEFTKELVDKLADAKAQLAELEPANVEEEEPKFETGKTYYIKCGDSYYTLKVESRTAKMLTGTTKDGTRKYHIQDTFRGEYVVVDLYDEFGNRKMIWAANEYKTEANSEREIARKEFDELNETRHVIEKDIERFERLRDRCKGRSPKRKEYNQLLESFDPIIRAFGEKWLAANNRYNKSLEPTEEERAAAYKAVEERKANYRKQGIKYFATVYYFPNGVDGEDMENFSKDCKTFKEAADFVCQEDIEGVYVGGIYDAGWSIKDIDGNEIADPNTGCGDEMIAKFDGDTNQQEDNKEGDLMNNFEWYTPPFIINAARDVLGSITLDPASSAIANETVKAEKFFTADNDGLKYDWRGNIWLNPPYSRRLIKKFTDKIISEYESGHVDEAIILVSASTETAWFKRLATHSAGCCFITGRLKFLQPDGSPSKDNFRNGSCAFYFGHDHDKFFEIFSRLGLCTQFCEHTGSYTFKGGDAHVRPDDFRRYGRDEYFLRL